ncbi:MAG TPA: glycoside hydrolase family 78 protein [Chitinophaga sp.]|uniref:glycoside hydrolase family 78 protein n=1 Tax=Chitinophaga sp. TaxID=1869181 RepID=UPI002DB6AF3E|nr:glycoside hydrolase family 78 protein [Chitinophaga sp.]HEU4555231.1 glycoside hydrolase family 78 protein [Chitinophaga sp.]
MKNIHVLAAIAGAALLMSSHTVFSQVKVQELRCEHLANPVGLDVLQPRFGWQLAAGGRNVMQTAYELKISANNKVVWNSGKVNSDSSVHVAYQGPALQPDTRYTWQVRVWDNKGKTSGWSAPAYWHTGLLNAGNWKAKWITSGLPADSANGYVPFFRKAFSTSKKIQSAVAYITAHGLYEAQLNGKRIGDAYLTPGWTSYHQHLAYQAYDVTDLLQKGNNAVGVMVGSGWYRGPLAWNKRKNAYGKDAALLFQLNIHYTDGTTETIVSDNSWKAATGGIVSSEIYDGEVFDARRQKAGWSGAGFDDSQWTPVTAETASLNNLSASYNELIKKHETFTPVKVITTPKGDKVLDFGQNLVGWVQVKVKGNAGDTVKIAHVEVLDKKGEPYFENLRSARAEDMYILKGGGTEVFEPHFTFHGFRYIRVKGINGALNPADFTAVALYSDMPLTGQFSCSDSLVNQLQHNIRWGQQGNFLDVPTDCPQRDERLGWTGDAAMFSRTATFNRQVNNFFAKWLKDVAIDQMPNGAVPFVIPNLKALFPDPVGATGWSDAVTIVPWNNYLAYADKRLIAEQYPSMKAWLGYIEKSAKNDLWNTGFQFGDWLSYRAEENDAFNAVSAVTDRYLVAQCFWANSAQIMINAANVLGKADDVAYYTDQLRRIKAAFLKEYVTPNGRLVSSTQTAYVLTLYFDMVPEEMRPRIVQQLVENIQHYHNHLTTGFLGTPFLCHVLSRFGQTEVAYQLLLQKTYPSWLYPVRMGATTIWERWDSMKPDSTFQDPGMTSFNHYAYGAIGDWMYRAMVGLDTYEDAPGYKHIKVQPHPGGGITFAKASLQTYYGPAAAGWKIADGQLLLDVEVPANTTATIYIPGSNAAGIQESGQAISSQKDIQVKGTENGYVVVNVGSGSYHFSGAL